MIFYVKCHSCHGFQWLSPDQYVEKADSERVQNCYFRREVAQPASSVAVVDAEDFDGGAVDQTTLACLQAIYPTDYPGQPVLNDEELAHRLAQMPENDSDFLAGLQPEGFHNPSTFLPNLDDLFCGDLGLHGDVFDFSYANFEEPGDPVMVSDFDGGFIEPPAGSVSIPDPAIATGAGGLGLLELSVMTERRKKPGTNAFYCITAGCNLAAKSGRCIRQMCKQHCAAQVTGSSCPAHRTVPLAGSSLLGAAASRVPLANSTAHNLATQKEYRTNMTPAHGELWEKMKQQQQVNIDVKQQRQEYQRIFMQQVIIYAWQTVSRIEVTW